jgi:hypothetical protein
MGGKDMATDWYTEFVATILEMPDMTSGIRFKFGGFSISGKDYKEIANRMRKGPTSGGLSVIRSSRNPHARGWFDGSRKMIAMNHTLEDKHVWTPSKPHGERLMEYSTWVHEATHAIQYIRAWNMTVGAAEIMAHLAQAIFLSRYGDHLLFNGRLVAAGVIARKLFDGDPETNATKADLNSLTAALKSVPRYRERWDRKFYIGQDMDCGA